MAVGTALEITYRVDSENRITSISPEWSEFATENDSPGLTEGRVLGRSLQEFIAGAEMVHVWEALLETVRAGHRIQAMPYRCDSPECRRFMEMSLIPLPGRAIELQSRVVREEPRPHVALLDPSTPRTDKFVTVCGWCKKVKLEAYEWVEMEEACRRLGLLERRALPGITHGVCLECLGIAAEEL